MKLNDLIIAVVIALGAVSEINWVNIPFWVYLVLGGVYIVFRLTGKDNKKFNLFSAHVGNHPPKPPNG